MTDDARVRRELARRTAVLAGDEAAWRAWYDEAYESLRTFVFWRVGREGVDEVVQETWLIAVKKIRHFDPRQAAFFDWLRGISVNVMRNRSRGRPAITLPLDNLIEEAASEQNAADRAARVASVLSALPDQYAAVLKAKYLEQQSVSDIAQEWNQTVKAIESLLTRARTAFRVEFGMEN